jgi:signal transduction histidine kinase
LNVAIGETELLRDECDSDRVDTVAQAHRRMEELIESVLTLVRSVEEGVTVESVAVATVAEQGWRSVDTADATLSVDTDQRINADPSQLQQLFENLFRNAVEHTDETVTIIVGAVANGFFVADTGPGIPPDEREEIFTSGYSTTADGTGLGLAIVNEVVRAHGWEITVEDSNQGGTQITITGVDAVQQTGEE